MWRRLGTAVAAGSLFAAILGGSAIATTDVAPPTTEPTAEADITFDDEWQFSPEELAEINAETDELVAHLEGLGFDITVETDDEGFRYPVVGEDDGAMIEAIDAFYQARFAEEVATWSDAQKAEWNTDIDAFIADLVEQGITATKIEIAPGVYDIDWTEELDEAFLELEGQFFGDETDWELSQDDIAEINVETDALVEHLAGLGFDVEVETDDDGIRYPVPSGEDDEAMMAAIGAFYEAQFTAEIATWSDAEKAAWNAGVDTFIAELADQGMTATKVEIAPGVYDIDWTDELDAALMESDGFFDGGDDIAWDLTEEDIAEMNADTDALVSHLEGLGFDVTMETDDDGLRYPVLTGDDGEIFDAIDSYYQELLTDEVATWSADEKAAWNAEVDAMIADLAEQGVTAAKVEIAPGVYDIDWTEDLDAAFMELSGESFAIIDMGVVLEEDAA